MKKASEIYNPNKYGWYDYRPMLEAFGEVLFQVDCGQYQGDSYLIIKSNDKYGYLNFGWGSCSGCDALQACANINEVQELMDQLYSQIQWFDSLKDLTEYFSNKDWSLDYAWYYDGFKNFVNKVINMNNIEHIGTFSLGNKVMVSDPCYKLNTWCQGVLENVKSGIWDAYLKMIDTNLWGIRVAELITVNSEHYKEHPAIMDEHQEFEVGVDSGCAGIFDYEYYCKSHTDDDVNEDWYEKQIMQQFFPGDESTWQKSVFTESNGVVSNSGYGDGGYDCYVARNDDDEIIGIKIVYIIEKEIKEEEDDD